MDYRDKTKDQLIEELKNCQARLESQNLELQQIALRLENTSAGHPEVFDFSPIGYFTLDTQGMILRANPASALVLGSDTDRILKEPFSRFVHQEDHNIFVFFSQKLQEGRSKQRCNIRLVKDDGTQLYAQLEGMSYFDEVERREKLLIAVIDYTPNKHLEDRINSVKKQWERIFDAMPDLVAILDTEHEIVWLNRAMAASLGMAKQEAIGAKCYQAVHGASEPPAYCPHAKAMQDGRQHHSEVIEPRLGGAFNVSVCPLYDTENKLIGSIHTARDISASRKMQAELAESEQLYRTFFQTSRDCVGITTLDGQILDINEAGIQMLGYGPDEKNEILQTSVVNFYANPEDRESQARVAAEKGFLNDFSVRFRKKDGSIFDALMTSVCRRDEQGNVTGFYATIRDITEPKRLEQELHNTLERLYTILSSSYVGFLLITNEGKVEFANQAFCDIFNIETSPRALTGLSATEVIEKIQSVYAQPAQALARIEQILAHNQVVKGEELQLTEGRTVLRDFVPINLGGRPYGRLWSHMDVSEQKRARAALLRSEEKYRLIFDMSPVGMVRFNSEGIVTDCNQKLLDILGASREQVIGFNLVTSLTNEFVRSAAISALSGKIGTYEGQYTSVTGGNTFWGKIIYSPLTEGGGSLSGGIAVVEDYSERRLAEEKLRSSEEQFRLLSEAITEVFWIADVGTGNTFYVSPAYEQVWGQSCESLYENPKSFVDSIHEEDRERVLTSLEIKKSGKPFEIEYRIVTPDGTVRWIWDHGFPIQDQSGEVTRYAGVAQDITDRKQKEVELRNSEERFALAMNIAREGVWDWDMRKDEVYRSPNFFKMLGYEPSDFQPDFEGWRKCVHPDDLQKTLNALDDYLSGRAKKLEIEFRMLNAQGKPVWILSQGEIVARDEDGNPTRMVGTHVDIASRKNLEAQLLQSQKMEAVGTLAAGIAHDFNNMLQIILGYSDMLLDEKNKGEPGYNELQAIVNTAIEARDLVQKIRLFSRKADIQPVAVDLNHQLTELTKLLSHTFLRTVGLNVQLAENLGIIKADPALMDQMVTNLAINASEAMPDGGTLTIETQNILLEDEFCEAHVGAKPGPHVLLTISDTGTGITRELVDRIFDPFFSTKQRDYRRGTGLGLSIVKGIVDEHSGYITVQSEVGKGTTFKIYFPILTTQEIPKAEPKAVIPTEGGRTILLVEDEELVRDLGIRLLERFGYTVIAVADGQEAVEAYAKHQEKIALVILDIVMPRMDGRECLQELLKINPAVKLLISSGVAQEDRVKEVVDLGAKGALLKPYGMKALQEKVREVLDMG